MLNNPFNAIIDKGGPYIPQLSPWNQSVNVREYSKHSEGQYEGKEKVIKINVEQTSWNAF